MGVSASNPFPSLGDLPDDVIADMECGRLDQCHDKCKEILLRNPTHGLALIYMGKIFVAKDDHQRAIPYFKSALEGAPTFYPVWELLGWSYLFAGEYQNAVDAYREVLAVHRTDALTWCSAAIAFQKLNKRTVAFYLLECAPQEVEKSGLELVAYTRGLLEEKNGDYDAAFMSYVKSQVFSTTEDIKNSAATRISRLLSKRMKDE